VAEPYAQTFEIQGKHIASVVCDQGDFYAFVDKAAQCGLTGMPDDWAPLTKEAKFTMLMRGSKTNKLFDHFKGIQPGIDLLCVAVRGISERMGIDKGELIRMMGQF